MPCCRRVFTCFYQTHLCYSSSDWDPYYKYDILTLEKVQRKGAPFVTGINSYTESVTSMPDDLHWSPLQHRRKLKRLVTFYKATNNLSLVNIPDYVATSSNRTRTHDLGYIQLHTNYEQYKNSFLPRTIREWNALPPDLVHAASADEFAARLQNHTF